jgi:hypothetical protein
MEAGGPVCFTVHGLRHLRAALAAGSATGRPVIVVSAESAGGYAGPEWFLAMARQGAAEFPEAPLITILDCGDRAGDALRALGAGIRDVIFTGHAGAARRLSAIAARAGARIHHRRPASLDLLDARDPVRAALRWCETGDGEGLPPADPFGYGTIIPPR